MKVKKVKDIASELIDDLLGSNGDSTSQATIPSISENKSDNSLDFSRMIEEEKSAVKPHKWSGGGSRGPDSHLIQSENLRVAQKKIFELENEIERLRTSNEKLAAAGETLKQKVDHLSSDNENKTRKLEEIKDRLVTEKEVLEDSLKMRDRELNDLKTKMDEYELRISSNIQKIRVRERELENRLEISKMENAALIRNKDEIILDMKRQKDHLVNELENYRTKGQELHKQLNEKQETLRRTVKALRLALNLLEGNNDGGGSGHKAS
jgi:chromosome segregation ATPase